MKKKLEADLISIAHRILQMKNKSDQDQVFAEVQKLYEKLAVMRFVDAHFSEAKPTVGSADIQAEMEQLFEDAEAREKSGSPEDGKSESPKDGGAEDGKSESQDVKAEDKKEEGDKGEGSQDKEGKPEAKEEAVSDAEAPSEEEAKATGETEAEPASEEDDKPAEKETEEKDSAAEAKTDAPKEDIKEEAPAQKGETPKEEVKGNAPEQSQDTPSKEEASKEAPEQKQEESQEEAPKEEPKKEEGTRPKQISFDDLMQHHYEEPVFVKAGEQQKETPTIPVPETVPQPEALEEAAVALGGDEDIKVIETPKADETPKPAQASEETRPETPQQPAGKAISIGLNDRIGFEKNLFGGSSEDMNRVLSQLNTFNSVQEATDFIEDMVKPDYNNWVGKEDYEKRFLDIVERKFS